MIFTKCQGWMSANGLDGKVDAVNGDTSAPGKEEEDPAVVLVMERAERVGKGADVIKHSGGSIIIAVSSPKAYFLLPQSS